MRPVQGVPLGVLVVVEIVAYAESAGGGGWLGAGTPYSCGPGSTYLIYVQLLYFSLLSFAYLLTNTLNHLAFTLASTFFSFLLQLL